MSDDEKQSTPIDDTISTVEDIPGSSISFSIRENSIYVKEKPKAKPIEQPDPLSIESKKEQWWLKKPTTQLDVGIQKKSVEIQKVETPILSPEILSLSSSMKEFLDKEKMCNTAEAELKDNDSTLQDILASVAFDKYQSDFENASDDDIGSILEEMSKTIAKTVSPVLESTKSNIEMLPDEGSIKELLQEAEKLVQQNGNDLLKGLLKTEIIVPDQNDTASEGLTRVRQLEVDIFKMIEQQDADNHQISKRSVNSSVEVLFENINTQGTLESQKKTFEEQKVEVSSNSDLDDPIERHSMSEDISEKKEENLKKEITDVDKDFFDALIKQTKQNSESLSSRSLSFDKEDFNHFLKLLQEQNEKEDCNLSDRSSLNLVVDQFDPLKEKDKSVGKDLDNAETKDILFDLESSMCQAVSPKTLKIEKKVSEESVHKESSKHSSRDSSKPGSAKSSATDTNNVVNDKNELYTVGLTPRLKLFADSIPKLLAEKSNEANLKKNEAGEKSENDITPKSDGNEDFSFKNFKALNAFTQMEVMNDHKNVTDVKDYKDHVDFKNSKVSDYQRNMQNSAMYIGSKHSSDSLRTRHATNILETRNSKGVTTIAKSRSYDQLSKSSNKLGSSLENIKNIKSAEARKPASAVVPKRCSVPKIKVQSKTVTKLNPKTRMSSKITNEPMKPLPNEYGLNVKGNQIKSYEDGMKNSFGGGDWIGTLKEDTLENLYQKEKQKFMHIKLELEAEIETYKSKLKDVQMLYEQEMFTLKKQNILLKAKIDEVTRLNTNTADARLKYDPKIIHMQKDLDRQESVINAYELENKKLIQEAKRLQSELKSVNQQKPKVNAVDNKNSDYELMEKLKDLQEENVKLNIEVLDLRQKNNDFSLKNEDVTQQNSLLQEELEMIKDQLRAKNDFITDRLQSMTTNELDLRKQVEDLKVELHSKTEQVKFIKQDYDRFQENVAPVEKEILDLRTKCSYYQDKLQTAKYNCEREKQLTLKLKDQVILDNKNIMDLNRQVREMERILKRKNPDSVSALILTANSENEKLNLEKVKLLEERICFLENEIKTKEDMAQFKLTDIQKKFTDMKDKYSMQVSDLELKLELSSQRERKIYGDASTQTIQRILESRGSEPNLSEKVNVNKVGPKSHNLKEDTHLIATIRGLKQELGNKDKNVSKLTKDIQELQKTNRKLQKERERMLNERRNEKMCNRVMTSSDSKLMNFKGTEINDPNSNFYQNGHAADGKRSMTSGHEGFETNRFKRLTSENEILKEELGRINKDFMALKNKRLQDLNILQEEHEKEIALIVKECSVKIGDTKVNKLQGQVNSQMAIISHLQQQIEVLQDYKEQVVVLKTERDHLEGKNRILSEKVKYLSTPSSQQLQVLQDKIMVLQQRHETREQSLQNLVRDLLRTRNEICNDCKNAGMKGKDFSYFRQDLDNILDTLQDLISR